MNNYNTLCGNIYNFTYQEIRNILKSGFDIYDAAVTIEGNKKTIFEVVQDKIYNKQREYKPGENEYWKRELKKMIIANLKEWFNYIHNKLAILNKYPGIYQSIDYPFMLAKPEYSIIVDDIESGLIITIRDYISYEWDDIEQGKCPENYLLYSQHLMAVMGWQQVFIFIFNNYTLDMRIINRDQFLIDKLSKDENLIFTKYIINKEYSPITKNDIDLIKKITPKKQIKKDCTEIECLIECYHSLTIKLNENNYLDKERSEIKAKILKFLDGAEIGICNRFEINNKLQFRIKKRNPEI